MELHPVALAQAHRSDLKGFYLVIHRKEKHSLAYLCGKRDLLSMKETSLMRRQSTEIFSSSAIENLSNSTNINEAIQCVAKYFMENFNLTRDSLIDELQGTNKNIESNLDLAGTSVGDYLPEHKVHAFKASAKLRAGAKKLVKVTTASRVASTFLSISPRNRFSDKELEVIRLPDMDFLDMDKTTLMRQAKMMFDDAHIMKDFNIDDKKWASFINEVQRLYDHRNNPFHNFKHGISVLHSTYYILRYSRASDFFDKIGTAAMLFAALMHDIDHSGKTNVYEMNSGSEIAIRYNDSSILESHHAATAFMIIKESKYAIFENMDFATRTKFRKIALHGILMTDVKHHFSHLQKFSTKINEGTFNPVQAENEEDFLLLVGQIVHTSDLYVPTKQVDHSSKWSILINDEFMAQNKAEKENNLPETPFYKNLDKMKVRAKSEKFFVEKIVTPLWVELDKFVGGNSLETQLKNLKLNLAFWEAEMKKLEEAAPVQPK